MTNVEVVPAQALNALYRQEIDTLIATAKKYPRPRLAQIQSRIYEYALLDDEVAEQMFYRLQRREKTGKIKTIEGPSVRLAEIAVVAYQNIFSASRVVANDGEKVSAQGICYDVENNILESITMDRSILGKSGTYSVDMQILTANACMAIASRNATFKVVPLALVRPVYIAAMEKALGKADQQGKKRLRLFERFAEMGVTEERVLGTLGKKSVKDCDTEDLKTLIGLGTAIKDGDLTLEEAFQPPEGSETTEERQARVKSLDELAAERRQLRAAQEKGA